MRRGFEDSSDYAAFLELGIPSSGIFTGAGAPEDACYHLACDDFDNINWDAITVNTKAAGRAAAAFFPSKVIFLFYAHCRDAQRCRLCPAPARLRRGLRPRVLGPTPLTLP